MIIRLSTINLKHGAVQDPTGAPEGGTRFDRIASAVRALKPDVLCLQEIHGWRDHNQQARFRAERAVDMLTAGGIPPVSTDPPTGGTMVMYNPRTVRVDQWETRHSKLAVNGMGPCVLDADGTPVTVISVHFPPYDTGAARAEAALAATRAVRYSPYGIIAGDVNHFPESHTPVPDPGDVPLLNRMGRWRRDDGEPDRSVAQTLSAAGFTDAATAADTHAATKATGHGGIRVDQVWASRAAAPGRAPGRSGSRPTPSRCSPTGHASGCARRTCRRTCARAVRWRAPRTASGSAPTCATASPSVSTTRPPPTSRSALAAATSSTSCATSTAC